MASRPAPSGADRGGRLVAIVGPTASGKSALALLLAARHGGEIVSCDSLQVYRGLDIGSAKATPEERALVRHHLIDVVPPSSDFSAAEYARLARAALLDIASRGRPAVVVGGTGLYLKALLEGLFPGPSRNEEFRRRVEGMARRYGEERVHRWLRSVDPEAAGRIPPRDLVRVVRALEVFFATGRTLSASLGEGAEPLSGFDVRVVGLRLERGLLLRRVEERTDAMLRRGLLDEVKGLLGSGLSPEARPLRAIGYRQAVEVLLLGKTVDEARRDIVTATMRYAKRQMTWFSHQANALWCSGSASAEAAAEAFLSGGRS